MSLQNLLNRIMDSGAAGPGAAGGMQGIGDALGKLAGNIPGGLAGGAAAGGIMALLMSSKSARKFAGKAASFGGAALLGGLAYKAYSNWRQGDGDAAAATGQRDPQSAAPRLESDFTAGAVQSEHFQLRLIMAMIAAAKADGHIDSKEQQAIFDAVEQIEFSSDLKGQVFDLLRRPIRLDELVAGVDGIEQKSELYLASCLAIDPDHPDEHSHLERLARALGLPEGLARHLQQEARMA